MTPIPRYTIVFFLSLLLFSCLPALGADQHRSRIDWVSDGHGRVDLAWLVNPARWPGGGWRLEDTAAGTVKVRAVVPGLAETPNFSDSEKEALVKDMRRVLAADQAELKTKGGIFLLLENLTDFNRLKTMGLAWTLHDVGPGPHRYRLTGLDRDGKKIGPVLETGPVDAARPTPPLQPPEKLSAEIKGESVLLHWQVPNLDSLRAAMSFTVKRQDHGRTMALPAKPFMTARERKSGKLGYRDSQPPPEAQLEYRVSGRDIFGRSSREATVALFFPDPQALAPPAEFTAKGGENRITLSWQPGQNPYTRGYLIERSRLATTKYRLLTPKPLSPKTGRFIDKEKLLPGLTYYYRIHSVNPRGRIGKPGQPVHAVATSAHAPAAPKKLTARVQATRVRLSWNKGEQPVAGYLVEKRSKGEKEWQKLNGVVETRTLFDDPVGPQDFGSFQYRVIAVGYDNKKSKPSREVTVTLLGVPPVPAPRLADIAWEEKGVRLSLQKGVPGERTAALTVIRGISQRDKKGVIVAESLPAKTTTFVDSRVRPGEDYWYALLATDKKGHRSPLSNKLYVRAGTRKIPTPERPELSFARTPFPHVVIRFDQPPAPLLTSVMRRVDDHSPWLTIADRVRGEGRVVDADPPASGAVAYRILYTAENGVTGTPSTAGRITMDEPE